MPYKVAGVGDKAIRTFKNPFPYRPSLPRYCPQKTTEMYNINYTIIPVQDLINYCELDTTGIYDFAQAP